MRLLNQLYYISAYVLASRMADIQDIQLESVEGVSYQFKHLPYFPPIQLIHHVHIIKSDILGNVIPTGIVFWSGILWRKKFTFGCHYGSTLIYDELVFFISRYS